MPRLKKSTSRAGSASKRSQSRDSSTPKKQKRQATVYDAVAGRVSSTGFIPMHPRVTRNRDTPSSSTVPNPPEEVLFRRAGAPTRYEEYDIYWADRHLTEQQKLPESDLLKAVHAYASDFYGRATRNKGLVDFESLDETALLSIGVLLEEMAEEVLGETGDLAFVEGEEEGAVQVIEKEIPKSTGYERAASSSAIESGDGRKRKRRKMRHGHDHHDAG